MNCLYAGATPTTPHTKYPSSCMVRIRSCTRGKMHVVAPYHSCASHIPCQHKSVWLVDSESSGCRMGVGVPGQGMRALPGQCMHACTQCRTQKQNLHVEACTQTAHGNLHVSVTLAVPPATLAQAHDMPQYPLHPTLTSMRVLGGSAEGRGGSTNTKSWNQNL